MALLPVKGLRGGGGGGPFFFFNLFLLHCVPLYVCRLCINYQDLRTNLLGVAALRILLLTFISHFVIDFLSIRNVIIFCARCIDLCFWTWDHPGWISGQCYNYSFYFYL